MLRDLKSDLITPVEKAWIEEQLEFARRRADTFVDILKDVVFRVHTDETHHMGAEFPSEISALDKQCFLWMSTIAINGHNVGSADTLFSDTIYVEHRF
jgi:hypothetical protein